MKVFEQKKDQVQNFCLSNDLKKVNLLLTLKKRVLIKSRQNFIKNNIPEIVKIFPKLNEIVSKKYKLF